MSNDKPQKADKSAVPLDKIVMPLKPHNYAVVQRLRLIDFILTNFGYVNRTHIKDYFGISTPQATQDIKNYMRLAPDNTRYSQKQKKYVRTVDFERVWA